jgi:hypothetical protein
MTLNVILKALKASTDNLFDDDFLRPYATQILNAKDNVTNKPVSSSNVDVPIDDEFNTIIDDIAELETKVFLREKIDKSLEELQQMKEWKNYQEGDWETFSRARGYTEKEIDDFAYLQELRNQILDDDGGLSNQIQNILNTLRNEYNKIKVDVDPDKILDKKYAPLVDFYTTKILNDGIAIGGRTSKSAITKEGARKLARDYVVKMVEELEPEESAIVKKLFSKISLKDETLPEEAVDQATREANLEEGISGSVIEVPIFRAYKDFHDFDFDPAFLFPREMGVHTGTQGHAHTIIAAEFKDMPSDWAKGQQIERRDMLEFLMKKAKENNMNFAITKGYARVRNPLRLKREPMSWKASEMLTMAGEFLNAIETQSKNLPPDFQKQFDDLTNVGFQIEQKTIDAPPLVSSRFHKYKNEALDASLTADVQRLLNRAGFDAIEYTNEVESTFKGEANKSYILFNPYQFKSTYGKALDFEDPRTAYSIGGVAKGAFKLFAPAVDGLFSPAEKAALNIQQKSGTGQAFINAIKKGEGVKEEELQATGFIDAFKDKQKVSLDEVQDFLSSNRYNLQTERADNAFQEYSLLDEEPYEINTAGQTYANIFKVPEGRKGSNYQPAHFTEGTMAHTRVTALPESNTNKQVYVIEEVQSDLHQAGRKYGYYSKKASKEYEKLVEKLGPDVYYSLDNIRQNKETSNVIKPFLDVQDADDLEDALDGFEIHSQRIADHINYLVVDLNLSEYFNAIEDIFDDVDQFFSAEEVVDEVKQRLKNSLEPGEKIDKTERDFVIDSMTDLYFSKNRFKELNRFEKLITSAEDEDVLKVVQEYSNNFKKLINKNEESLSRLIKQRSDKDYKDIAKLENQVLYGVPDVPYKKDWYKLALRKSLIDAVNQDFDKIGLTTSEIQAKRYEYEGDKAKGFVKYYDEIYPKFLKDFGKKYGADVELTTVKTPSGREFEIWAMELTPEMKKDIQKGLPKFMEGGYVVQARDVSK